MGIITTAVSVMLGLVMYSVVSLIVFGVVAYTLFKFWSK